MKNLKEYVLEAVEHDEKTTKETAQETQDANQDEPKNVEPKKVFTFDFSGLEDSKEVIDKLKEIGEQKGIDVSDEDGKITFEVLKDAIDEVDEIEKVISEYVGKLKNSQKRFSNEQYAQIIKKFANVLTNLDEYIEDVKNSENE